ncbi:MAG: NADH-quinone oxidoreductase subunit NuoG [Nitrosomonas sp.]|nr:MAG: NADH-quinone oxidoreductase subunit NuoG [Nitrosomonas sp.]
MTPQTTQQATMVNLTIDGHAVAVPKGTTVYTAAKQLGIEIPIFCYHDRMPPFGACRMCLVEVEKMTKLQTSCTLEVNEGMVVKTQSSSAEEGRKGILEFLLVNHPLDCPICDKGGECPLQDQTLKYGPGESRFHENKRHFSKRLPLGPVLMLDRERCIVCARCTRFGDVVAGDHALEFVERGYRTEVGTPGGKSVESKFIGNTIQICPVGALTSDVYRFQARPWDNHPTKSCCTLCPVGCSMTLDSRDGEIVRTRSYENHDVNDVWLCDKGSFGYEFTNHPDRLKQPLIRRGDNLEPATWEEALNLVATKIKMAKPGGKLAALGGNPLTTEESYLLQKLMRQGAGVNNVDHRIGTPLFDLEEEGLPPGMEISIGECSKLSYAILIGIDLTEEFPIIWLRLKEAINNGAKVLFLGHFAPEIAPHLTRSSVHPPGSELEALEKIMADITALVESGHKGAIFVGRQYLHTANRKAILSKLLKVRNDNVSLNILEGSGNSFGARLAGMRPDAGPAKGLNTLQILESASKGPWNFLYVAGADVASNVPARLWQDARDNIGFLVVQDLFLTQTARDADVVLPALCYAEKEGSFVNIEGRVQKLKPGKDIPKEIFSDGDIFKKIAIKLGITLTDMDWQEPERIHLKRPSTIEAPAPQLSSNISLHASFAPALFDNGVRMKRNPHIIQLAKEPRIRLHPLDASKRHLEEGDRVRIKAQGTAISAKLRIDDTVSPGAVVIPVGFKAIPAYEIGSLNGVVVEVEGEGGAN